ncbi:MAG: hypothetical protein WCI71_20115 [Bacteroidota bacterium]
METEDKIIRLFLHFIIDVLLKKIAAEKDDDACIDLITDLYSGHWCLLKNVKNI